MRTGGRLSPGQSEYAATASLAACRNGRCAAVSGRPSAGQPRLAFCQVAFHAVSGCVAHDSRPAASGAVAAEETAAHQTNAADSPAQAEAATDAHRGAVAALRCVDGAAEASRVPDACGAEAGACAGANYGR